MEASDVEEIFWEKMLSFWGTWFSQDVWTFAETTRLFYNKKFIFHWTMIKHLGKARFFVFPKFLISVFWQTSHCFQSGPCFNASPHISRAVTSVWWRMTIPTPPNPLCIEAWTFIKGTFIAEGEIQSYLSEKRQEELWIYSKRSRGFHMFQNQRLKLI